MADSTFACGPVRFWEETEPALDAKDLWLYSAGGRA